MNEIAELVATASRVLAANGHDDLIWGHASVRDPDGRGAWLKTAEWSLGEITPDRVHLVDDTGTVRDGAAGPRHSEYPIHTEILAARPDVGAVVHTHPPHAVALAASGQPLVPVSHAATMFVPPEVPRFTDTADLILTAELGKRVAEELGEANALFLVNHGVVTVGPDLPTAVVTAVILERACAQQILTRTAGGWPAWSSPEEALAKREHIYHPTALAAVWDHLVRELDR
jgi:ribulose-5-phosphate 4-epimerase/fuculose-1-phosphate aldolase